MSGDATLDVTCSYSQVHAILLAAIMKLDKVM